MPRTDRAHRVIAAPRASVFAALVDEHALEQWLPPDDMTGRFEHFDARPGGGYRLVLTYADDNAGKAGDGTDVVEARFTEVVSDKRVVQAVDFESDRPEFAGTMTMSWSLSDTQGGTLVEFRADDVPDGISAEDHAQGLAVSLANLDRFLSSGAAEQLP